jgi:hypothetical protein
MRVLSFGQGPPVLGCFTIGEPRRVSRRRPLRQRSQQIVAPWAAEGANDCRHSGGCDLNIESGVPAFFELIEVRVHSPVL